MRSVDHSESYCRVLVEAYAHGVVPVAQRDYAMPELVCHGETGFLADSSVGLADYASWLAYHPSERLEMAHAGRELLERHLINEEASLPSITSLLDIWHTSRIWRRAGTCLAPQVGLTSRHAPPAMLSWSMGRA